MFVDVKKAHSNARCGEHEEDLVKLLFLIQSTRILRQIDEVVVRHDEGSSSERSITRNLWWRTGTEEAVRRQRHSTTT